MSRRVFLKMEKCFCTKSELSLFDQAPVQMAIDRSSFVEIHPVASISDNPTIEFLIPGLGESYYDLSHLYLKVQAKIVKADGTVLADADKCAPVNYLLNTMFSECHVSLNDRQISSENNYAYKSIIQALLFHPEHAQKNILTAALFKKDTPGAYEDLSLEAAGKNTGLRSRYNTTKEGKTFELYGSLHIDLGTQPKLLVNGVSIRVKLEKAKSAFALLAAKDEFRLAIENASLFIRRCEISGSILVAHEKALESRLIQMPFTRIELKTFTISPSLKSHTISNAVNGALPTRMILALCSNTAYNGDITKNPFKFHHYKLNHLSLTENGIQIPSSAFTPSYTNDWYTRNYLSLFKDLGQVDTNITYDEYKNGLCFYVFNLTQDYSSDEGHVNITRSGDLSIHLKFDDPLTETLTLLCYMEMQSSLEIDKSRSVFIDY